MEQAAHDNHERARSLQKELSAARQELLQLKDKVPGSLKYILLAKSKSMATNRNCTYVIIISV